MSGLAGTRGRKAAAQATTGAIGYADPRHPIAARLDDEPLMTPVAAPRMTPDGGRWKMLDAAQGRMHAGDPPMMPAPVARKVPVVAPSKTRGVAR